MNTATRNPDLDPVKVNSLKITHTGSNNRVAWIGRQVKVTLRNGDVVYCNHDHGHRTADALRACAADLVARLNRAAGTSTRAVEDAKAAQCNTCGSFDVVRNV